MDVKRVKISELIQDSRNANLHTERGVYMVSRSLEELGAGRSILIDKDNEIIAGNLTAEQAADMGLEEVIIVPTDGRQLVAVQRVDMDLDDPATGAREMAYADNRAAVVSIDFDPDVIGEDLKIGIDLGDWFHDWELGLNDFPLVGAGENEGGKTHRGLMNKKDYEWTAFEWRDLMFLLPMSLYQRVLSYVEGMEGGDSSRSEIMTKLLQRGLDA